MGNQHRAGMRRVAIAAAGLALVLAAGCGSGDEGKDEGNERARSTPLPQGSQPVDLDPADFSTRIDNPYWPMAPGSRWVYREREEGKPRRVEVTVTDRTRRIANGVTARVVHDRVTEDGQLVEDTYDWYAQDRAGNVWYLGEETREYENGRVTTTEGSWEAGVRGAQPGVIVLARPRVGQSYRQEYFRGEADDVGRVLSLNGTARVPFSSFDSTLVTADTTRLEPRVLEHKHYARGVGPVLTETKSPTAGREELVEFRRGRG